MDALGPRKKRTPSEARNDAQNVRKAAATMAQIVKEGKRANKAARTAAKENDSFAEMFSGVSITGHAATDSMAMDFPNNQHTPAFKIGVGLKPKRKSSSKSKRKKKRRASTGMAMSLKRNKRLSKPVQLRQLRHVPHGTRSAKKAEMDANE